MRRAAAFAALAGALALSGCGDAKLPKGVSEDNLTQAVGRAVGSASTCVLIADAAGKVVWTGGGYITCARNLPDCAGGVRTAEAVLKSELSRPGRFASCDSVAGGAQTVAWAMGPVPAGQGRAISGLRYVAVMEGERALPGIEVKARVERAFVRAGF